jgi:hypothetical protein
VNIIEKAMAENGKLKKIFAIVKESNESGSHKTIEDLEFSREEQRKYIVNCLGLAIDDPKVNEILNGKDNK